MSSNKLYKIPKQLKDQKGKRIEYVASDIKGTLLLNRYLVERLIDQGSCGQVYKCIDIENPDRPLVIKVSDNREIMKKEIKALIAIEK